MFLTVRSLGKPSVQDPELTKSLSSLYLEVQTLISQYNADVAKAAKKERERQQKVRNDYNILYDYSLSSDLT
jgi:hypothetical protein